MISRRGVVAALAVLAVMAAPACSRRSKVPVPLPPQPAPTQTQPPAVTPPPPPPREPVEDLQPSSPPLTDDPVANRTHHEHYPNSPLQPAIFGTDSADLDDAGRAVVSNNVDVMKKYSQWVVTIEGHCDERGTAEYNLALGERRAVAVKTYMVSLGIGPDRVRTVSYGKEFPFDQAHTDEAWSRNRRAHFVITAK
jgi:peptidoglycan-associated lipoprotein